MRILQHKQQNKSEWAKRTFLEQVANIGSEIHRTISWDQKGNQEYRDLAFYRSLELFDLTLSCKHSSSKLREIARSREAWVDFIEYNNVYNTSAEQWKRYFDQLLVLYRNTMLS